MDKIIGNDYIFNTRKVRLIATEENKAVYWDYENGKYDWLHINNISSLITIDTKQDKKADIKPVYTQAMVDAGVMPLVGMECCYSSSSMVIWNKCTVIAYYDGFVWTSDNGIRPLANTRFKPLTPPIELIDGKAYQFDYKGEHIGLYEKDDDEFIGIGINHAREMCANIQLLEVKSQ